MATANLKAVCIDCAQPTALARWWAPVLGYTVRPYTVEDLADLAGRGLTPETDPGVAVDPPEGTPGPTVWFNRVPEPKTVKDRVHLDVYGDWRAVVAAGATVVEEREDWVVLADPEGHEFCVFPPG